MKMKNSLRPSAHLSTNRVAVVLGMCLLWVATLATAADFDRFVGSYSGSAQVEYNGESHHRDMSVVIAPTTTGFEVKWKSVSHKSSGRIKEKEYTIGFQPSERDGIYSSTMGVNLFGNAVPLDPMKGDPYVWSRISGDLLTVYSLHIYMDGGYEMQEYNRTLASGGLDLEYLRIRNGKKLKSIRVFLKKK